MIESLVYARDLGFLGAVGEGALKAAAVHVAGKGHS